MSLTTVTITGADDGVDHAALYALSAEFPFVEWGILHSVKRQGTPRYPSNEWVRDLIGPLTGKPLIRLAAHLCGEYTRWAMAGDEDALDTLTFQRHQINGFELPTPAFLEMSKRVPTEFILQARHELNIELVANVARAIKNDGGQASVLYDPSGGRGVEALQWPVQPKGAAMGYAGGIKPSNVEQILRDIGDVEAPFWIDMESGVRTDDRFDLVLVRDVLEKCAPFVINRTTYV